MNQNQEISEEARYELEVTPAQFARMKYALDGNENFPEGETAPYWRNYCWTPIDEEWEALRAKGFANRMDDPYNPDWRMYMLTREGIKFIEPYLPYKLKWYEPQRTK